jgi:hypothetical protein
MKIQSFAFLAACAAIGCKALPCAAGDLDETQDLIWSTDATSDTPEWDRKFRGEFSNQDVTARLEKMPAHDYLQISFQLFILRSWDGMARSNNGRSRMGPDFIRAGLDDGRTLLHAVFSNTPVYPGFSAEATWQTYPSPMPGDRSPYMTGADLKNSLGYFFFSNPSPPHPMRQDAIYTLKMLVPHSADKVMFHVRGMGLQAITDESWGIADLHITPLAKAANQIPVPAGTAITLESHDGAKSILVLPDIASVFQTACGHDAMAANTAYWRLVSGGDATAEYLAKNVKARAVDAAKIKELVTAVYEKDAPQNENDPRVKSLLALGPTIEPVVRELRDESMETPSRLDFALMEISATAIDDASTREWMLATRILDAIATPRAKEVRTALMAGK